MSPSFTGNGLAAGCGYMPLALVWPLFSPSVEAIYPVSDPVALQDRRVTSLIHYAMKVEKAMFETVTSREEYYQLLAEKIDRIRKELEQRRMMKSAMENKRQMGGVLVECLCVTESVEC